MHDANISMYHGDIVVSVLQGVATVLWTFCMFQRE